MSTKKKTKTKTKTKVSVAAPASEKVAPKAGFSGFDFKLPELPKFSLFEPEPEPTEVYPQVAALREVLSILENLSATRAVWVLRCARMRYPQDPLSMKKPGLFRG